MGAVDRVRGQQHKEFAGGDAEPVEALLDVACLKALGVGRGVGEIERLKFAGPKLCLAVRVHLQGDDLGCPR